MKALAAILLACALACAAQSEEPTQAPASEYAPGSIRRTAGGWNVRTPKESFFLRDSDLPEVPEELAPIAALLRARSVDRRANRWLIRGRDGDFDVFKDLRDFTVTTPRESFRVLHRIGNDYETVPGAPGERRISIEEYIGAGQGLKKNPPKRN